ncbi:MAG: hypothetical protein JW762_04660 [Dehalococcoidales bacterium]|nr:hypothetical protein [Dehalococcoidales bacterium]
MDKYSKVENEEEHTPVWLISLFVLAVLGVLGVFAVLFVCFFGTSSL